MSKVAIQNEQKQSFHVATRPFSELSAADQAEARRQLHAKLQYMRDKDREKIKGRFKYYECPGGRMKFVFKKYKQDPIEKYDLMDGEITTLPLGVIKHLNKDCFYTIHKHATDKDGNAIQVIGQKIQRCEFIPMEFVDIEDLSPSGTEIVTVQHLL
jgi:hypothetical protein